MATIYKMTNTITGEIYVGCTTKTVNKRFLEHKSRSKNDKYLTIKLYKSIRDYGFDNFIIESLFECNNSEKELCEINTISKYDSFNNGLNHTIGGKGIIGYEYTKEHQIKRMNSYNKNGHNRKNKTYIEIYGEKSLEESEKRRIGMKKSWESFSEESRVERSMRFVKILLDKSGYDIDEMIKIRELNNSGIKPRFILELYPHLSKQSIHNILDKRKWKNLEEIKNL